MALKFRRGTTAQQSGSLAFGEPFVNTTLGTLLVGGDTGDIRLAVAGTGSTGTFGAISGSGLDITGNANIAGNLTLGGNITIGDATTDTVAINADLSSSIIPDVTNTFDLGSTSKVYRNVYATSISGAIASTNGVVSGSSQIVGILAPLNSFSSSQETKNTTLASYTGSVDTKNSTLATYTASLETKNSTLATYTASLETKNSSLATLTGSLINSASIDQTRFATIGTYTASLDTKNSTLATYTASLETKNSTLATYTGSNDTKWSTLGSLSGSFARIDSTNTFNGNQTVSGSVTITQDLIVLGSSSIQTISSSRLDIGDNIIQLNVNSPTARFGGLTINDSGSAGFSGSFLYDSVQDEFIFVHKGNGTNVTSSHFVLGPETIDNLGNETYLTNNRVPKGTGKEHLNDSNITDSGTLITLGSNTVVNGTFVASGTSLVSSSAQIVGSSITTNTITIGSTSTALGGTSTTLAGLTSVSSTGFTGALTGNASTATTLQTARTINGTSFNGSADITIPNLVSGSSQIAIASTNGYDANKYVDHTTVSISAGNGLSGGGTIAATRTLSLDTASATFTSGVTTQNNALTVVSGSKTISGITLGSNLGTLTISTGLSGTSYNGSTGVTIANTGVLSITSNTGLSSNVSATGNVTITNTGVTGITAGTGISRDVATGGVTITNTGVTSNVAGTGVSVSGATGAVTISIGQAVGTTDNVRFGSIGVGMAASGTSGRIDAAGDIVAYSTSDRNFKENITPIENPIQKIRQISGNTYDWKVENKDIHGFEGNDVGVIAQEIEEVLPQLVTTRETGYKAVKYDKLVALLIEGIKEQQLQIEKLQLEVIDLKKQKGL